jgi:hypothetical protein
LLKAKPKNSKNGAKGAGAMEYNCFAGLRERLHRHFPV